MYIDLIILILLIIAVVFFFRRFSSFIYLMVSLDILYRLLHFIANNVKVPELTALIKKYVPTDMIGLISKYTGTDNIIYTIVIWLMFLIYCIFLGYIIRILVKRNL